VGAELEPLALALAPPPPERRVDLLWGRADRAGWAAPSSRSAWLPVLPVPALGELGAVW